MSGLRRKDCERCKAKDSCDLDPACGAWVCSECDHHNGLARCFCGWSLSGADGRAELVEMGETIEPEP